MSHFVTEQDDNNLKQTKENRLKIIFFTLNQTYNSLAYHFPLCLWKPEVLMIYIT